MSCRRTNSWGDPIDSSQSLTVGQEYPGPSSHAEMSWTVCYDDGCEIHLHEKQGSGWFPKRKNRKGPRNGNGKGKRKGARRDLDEDDPEDRPWGDRGDGGGCPIPTEEEVKVILARKAAREAAEAKAVAASGVKRGVRIGWEEEEVKPKAKITGGVKPKAAPEVKSDWAEKIRELLAGGVKASGDARLNTPKYANNSSGGFPAEAVVKPMSFPGNPTPAVAKRGPRSGKGQFTSPGKSTIAPANLNPIFEKKLFTSPPLTTAKTPQRTHFTPPHATTTSTPTQHNPTFEKRSTPPPVTTTHAPVVSNSNLEKKQRFPSSPTANPHQKQPLQPRKDQGKTNLYPKPSKMSRDPPVATTIPTAVIAARAAATAKLACEREEKLPQMVRYERVA